MKKKITILAIAIAICLLGGLIFSQEQYMARLPKFPKATDSLARDSQMLMRITMIMDTIGIAINDSGALPIDPLEKVIDVVTEYIQKGSYVKEEKVLFPLIINRVSDNERGVMSELISEHSEARSIIKQLQATIDSYRKGDVGARRRIVQQMKEFTHLVVWNLERKQTIVYPTADRILSEQEQRKMLAKFKGMDRERTPKASFRRYNSIIKNIEKELGR